MQSGNSCVQKCTLKTPQLPASPWNLHSGGGTKEVHRRLAPDEQVILRGGAPTHPQGNANLSVQLQAMP